MSDLNSSEPKGTDWTSILTDPDLVRNVGKLLQAYREAPPEGREEALLKAMQEIKGSASVTGEGPAQARQDFQAQGQNQSQAVPAPTFTSPPFEPDIFTPNSGDDRRRHPRIKSFVAVELRVDDTQTPIWGNLCNTSSGGCLVETAQPVRSGAKVEIGLWVANGKIWIKGFALTGIVTRSAPTTGVRVRFEGMEPGERDNLRQFLKYVQEAAREKRSESTYLEMLK